MMMIVVGPWNYAEIMAQSNFFRNYAQYLKTKSHKIWNQSNEPFQMVAILNYIEIIWCNLSVQELTMIWMLSVNILYSLK